MYSRDTFVANAEVDGAEYDYEYGAGQVGKQGGAQGGWCGHQGVEYDCKVLMLVFVLVLAAEIS